MRVLHVYSGNLFGGIETALVTFAASRRKIPDFEQDFALCFQGRLWSELVALDSVVYDLGKTNWRFPNTIVSARAKLEKLLQTTAYDCVICHSPWILGIFGSIVRKLKKPLVFWVHDFLTGKSWVELTASLSQPDLVICNSRHTLRSVEGRYSGVRTEVVYCPVRKPLIIDRDVDNNKQNDESVIDRNRSSIRRKLRQELGLAEKAIVVLQASRMEKCKGQQLVLEALNKIKHLQNWSCIFAGGPQRPHEARYFSDLKASCAELGLDSRVQFLGQRTDVADLMASADIFVQPNLTPETFGITFVEAMYSRLPTIGVAGGGTDEIVTSETGILLPHPDANLLAVGLSDLMASSETRALLEKMGSKGLINYRTPISKLSRFETF